jgi:hypothetical protein
MEESAKWVKKIFWFFQLCIFPGKGGRGEGGNHRNEEQLEIEYRQCRPLILYFIKKTLSFFFLLEILV